MRQQEAEAAEKLRKQQSQRRAEEEKSERQRKQAQYKAWMEERKAANQASSTRSAVNVKVQPATVDISHIEAKIEERRIRWIQECTPWR